MKPSTSIENYLTATANLSCDECSGDIEAGEIHQFIAGIWGEEFHQFITCIECDEARDWFFYNNRVPRTPDSLDFNLGELERELVNLVHHENKTGPVAFGAKRLLVGIRKRKKTANTASNCKAVKSKAKK